MWDPWICGNFTQGCFHWSALSRNIALEQAVLGYNRSRGNSLLSVLETYLWYIHKIEGRWQEIRCMATWQPWIFRNWMPASVLGGGKQLHSWDGGCGVEWIALELVITCAWNRSMENSQSKQKNPYFLGGRWWNTWTKMCSLTRFDHISILIEFSKPNSMAHRQKHSINSA